MGRWACKDKGTQSSKSIKLEVILLASNRVNICSENRSWTNKRWFGGLRAHLPYILLFFAINCKPWHADPAAVMDTRIRPGPVLAADAGHTQVPTPPVALAAGPAGGRHRRGPAGARQQDGKHGRLPPLAVGSCGRLPAAGPGRAPHFRRNPSQAAGAAPPRKDQRRPGGYLHRPSWVALQVSPVLAALSWVSIRRAKHAL